jgi:aminoglycoside/choline kinase family phosphotransferase
MNSRTELLQQWLIDHCQLVDFFIQTMPVDASFRRYFRVQHALGSFVVMDAELERHSCLPYIAITQALRAQGLQTPDVIASDLEQGFLLLTDFGDKLLLKELNPENAENLYSIALRDLAVLQGTRDVPGWQVPQFTAEFMRQELAWYQEWFLQTHLGLTLSPATQKALATCFDFLATTAASQPQVFMHRDYHSANLMVLPHNKIGILDFQDAYIGPVTYDLVSLLRDCYIAWPEELVTKLVLQYRDQLQLAVSDAEFLRWFDLMGLQRHLKALLTFARKYHRDGNPNYLQHIPRTVNYIATIGERYAECDMLCALMNEAIICVQ